MKLDSLAHVFLPRRLPGATEDTKLVELEADLLQNFSTFLCSLNLSLHGVGVEGAATSGFRMVQHLFRSWSEIQNSNSSLEFSTKIMELVNPTDPESGSSFAFCVREQNATIHLTNEGSRLRFSSFIASQSNESTFQSESDLVAEFPGICVDIPASAVLRSPQFAYNLMTFSSTPYAAARKQRQKAGNEFDHLRNCVDPMLVTQFVTSVLSDRATKPNPLDQETTSTCIRIKKKIRDQIVYDAAKKPVKPFRRSGLWLSIKVVLQLELTNKYGAEIGLLLYKLVMLHFMTSACDDWCLPSNNVQLDADLLPPELKHQMTAKLARRLAKIVALVACFGPSMQQNTTTTHPNITSCLSYAELVKTEVERVVRQVQENMHQNWATAVERNVNTVSPLPLAIVESSAILTLKNTRQYLKATEHVNGSGHDSSHSQYLFHVPNPPARTRFRPTVGQLDLYPLTYLTSTEDEQLLGLLLYDFERYIYTAPAKFLSSEHCPHFVNHLKTYLETGLNYYKQDPVGCSRMVLTCLKILKMLDELAVENHPLLKSYKTGLSDRLISSLLLPSKQDMMLASDIESYFQTRNNAAKYPCFLEESKVTPDSFAVSFATNNTEMKKLRKKILRGTKSEMNDKVQELEAQREECEKWRKQVVNLACTYIAYTDGTQAHSGSCRRCQLSRQIEYCKVDVYEKLLPEDDNLQNCVVFELMIPVEIASLRDALFLFMDRIGGNGVDDNDHVYGTWTCPKLDQIHNYYKSGRHQKHVTLGSTRMLTKTALRATGKEREHVSRPNESFIVNNGYNCRLVTNTAGREQTVRVPHPKLLATIKKLCTMEVERGSDYAEMQWMVNSTHHTQNRVLASQYKCPPNLSLAEYKEFGSLRAGHRLQYRNLLRALALQSLSFRQQSVLTLVCQTIWEAGPALPRQEDEDTSGTEEARPWRDAHQDIGADIPFTGQLLSVLDALVSKNRKNWSDHLNLLTVVLVSNRILSKIAGLKCDQDEEKAKLKDVYENAVKLLLECRKVAYEWTTAIEKQLANANTNASANAASSGSGPLSADQHQHRLRLKLVEIASIGALTFGFMLPCTFELLDATLTIGGGKNMKSLSMWLIFIAKIDDNILLTNTRLESLSHFTRNLLRWVRILGVNLESCIHGLANEARSTVLGQFAEAQWAGAPHNFALQGIWECCTDNGSEQPYLWKCTTQDRHVSTLQMDVVLGRFLVDGKPIGRLPFDITNHSDFKRLFGNHVFVVQNYGNGRSVYITKDPFHGNKYKFQLGSQFNSQQLVVTEIDDNLAELELVPHWILKGDIPKLLIQSHSHWNDRTQEMVLFRPQNFYATDFKTNVKYILDLKTSKLSEIGHGHRKLLVDINSQLHELVSEVMARLENSEYVHVFLEDTELGKAGIEPTRSKVVLNIELPRMDLHFFVSPSGMITSKEHDGFSVAPTQGFGSLIGLEQSLLLESDNNNSRLLIPHGEPNAEMGFRYADGHHKVVIDTLNLRSPPCFVYTVDETLQRLVAQPVQSAWLYLAHLHALSSGVLPEPFTGLTGTESAVTLLQSPLCWSCEPTDEESERTLRSIQGMSPVRQYYPEFIKEMESVTFPEVIPSLCASDAYTFLVEKLLSDSNRMASAYVDGNGNTRLYSGTEPGGSGGGGCPKVSWPLMKRAYWRYVHTYSPQAQIHPEFDPQQFGESQSPQTACAMLVSSLDLDSNTKHTSYRGPNLSAIRLIADCGHNWSLPSNIKPQLLTETICSWTTISRPVSHTEFQTGYSDWIRLDVVVAWLGLYNYARLAKQQGFEADWTLMMAAILYSEERSTLPHLLEQLKILHTIAVKFESFADLNPPSLDGTYRDTSEAAFNRQALADILGSFEKTYQKAKRQGSETLETYQTRERSEADEHKRTFKLQRTKLLTYLESAHGALDASVFSCQIGKAGPQSHFVGLEEANRHIVERLTKWYWNKQLREFIAQVETRLHEIQTTNDNFQPSQPQLVWPELTTAIDKAKLGVFASRPTFNVSRMWMQNIRRERTTATVPLNAPEGSQESHNQEVDLRALMASTFRRVGVEVPHNSMTTGDEQYPLNLNPSANNDTSRILREYDNDLRESWSQYLEQRHERRASEGNEALVQLQLNVETTKCVEEKIRQLASKYWNEAVDRIQMGENQVQPLRAAGILFRTVPTTIYPWLCDRNMPKTLLAKVERVATAQTYSQRLKRCLRYQQAGDSMQPGLARELDTIAYEGWSPCQHPEWLLLQLELDLMIRGVQVDVAERMAKSTGPHALMQLNMGEGKTSVIIPMLATTLANGTNLCRITVLKSLYKTNKKMLSFSLGGLLRRRVYTFPCRRDMNFNESNLQQVQQLYEECLARKGLVVTVPEFRLSFQLKLYEMCGTSMSSKASLLWKTHCWLEKHVRDVLDECDEILNAKYQLVYTIGEKQDVSGGESRYTVCQKLLKILPKHLRKAGAKATVGKPGKGSTSSCTWEGHAFPPCRILEGSCYSDLCLSIANDILSGKTDISLPEFPPRVDGERCKNLVHLLMTEPGLSREDHTEAVRLLESAKPSVTNTSDQPILTEKHVETILILRGLLAYGVVLHCLSRRWRVNYGVNTSGPKKMAVPFRAKDISSERTEFGHIDVAILLTQLSYYYSGLNEKEVLQCFEHLNREVNGELVYQSWISGTPADQLPETLSTRASINLADSDQTFNVTIPALQMNTKVIDYWLSKVVYPSESKQFQLKLTCTPWDLCSQDMLHPVTGFSGTNDTKLLLPLTVTQDELPKLKGTNGLVLHNILKPENDNYTTLKPGPTTATILQKLVEKNICLLLDVGALITDLDNEGVAREWLKCARHANTNQNSVCFKAYKAAVYFNDADEIMVLDASGRKTLFNLSPYASNLENCLIYLDDHHTRGTDLKIPRGSCGAVTLGKGVTKDKLVQGCMRMRLLGNGHTLAFYASAEVDMEIRSNSLTAATSSGANQTPIGVKDILLWALNNSACVTKDGIQHWTLAAANYYTKSGAHALVRLTTEPTVNDLRALSELCRENEELELWKLYSPFRRQGAFSRFANTRLTSQSNTFEERFKKQAPDAPEQTRLDIMDGFAEGINQVVRRCRVYTSNVVKFSTLLDEEQERELETEEEEQRQMERPEKVTPARSECSPELLNFIKTGGRSLLSTSTSGPEQNHWCVPLPRAFKNTRMWEMVQEDCWGRNMFATEDFCRVVKLDEQDSSSGSGVFMTGVSEYLRSPTWFISYTIEEESGTSTRPNTNLLLLSPFEANLVKLLFNSPTSVVAKGRMYLHMFAARVHPDHFTFWLNPALILPSPTNFKFSFAAQLNATLLIQNHKYLNANLLIFSGSLFFQDESEQSDYCQLIGLVPEPRTSAEETLVAEGSIVGGWLTSVYRMRCEAQAANDPPRYPAAAHCKFLENPIKLVNTIIECRHGGVIPACTHVCKLLQELKKPMTRLGAEIEEPMEEH